MSTPARTPAAGLPSPRWPARPVPPVVPADSARGATPTPHERPRPADHARPPAPPAAPPAASADEGVVVTAEEQALDPRTIARASLAAGRNRSLWWTLGGIATAVAAAFVWDAVVGVLALAVLLLVYAVVRALAPAPGPAAVSVRSRPLDVAVLVAGAAALVLLAWVLPAG